MFNALHRRDRSTGRAPALSALVGSALVVCVLGAASTAVAGPITRQPTVSADAAALDPSGDLDGDGLLNGWEESGLDADGDGVIDVDLPAYGADPRHKDLFVETDFTTGQLPARSVYDEIVATYAEAPVDNPDGTTGITAHLDGGSAIGGPYDLGGGGTEITGHPEVSSASTVRENKAEYMLPGRSRVFRYMWWANIPGLCGTAFRPGSEFLAKGSCGASTFVHELGHNLGLAHGGGDTDNNKPNYLSVMNYSFSRPGLPVADGSVYRSYSETTTRDLNEAALSEADGLGPLTRPFRTVYWDANGQKRTTTGSAESNVDWNGNGRIDPGTVSVDVNNDGRLSWLTGQNDWLALRYDGGAIGPDAGSNEPLDSVLELDPDLP